MRLPLGVGELDRLREKAEKFKNDALATSTKAAITRQCTAIALFCLNHDLNYLPASVDTLAMFMAHLHDSPNINSPDTIAQYLSSIKTLHKLGQFPTDQFDSTYLTMVKQGLRKDMSHIPRQATPMTNPLLRKIYRLLDQNRIE